MISLFFILLLFVIGIAALPIFSKIAILNNKYEAIYESELLIRNSEENITNYLLLVNGFCIDNYIVNNNLDIILNTMPEIEYELMMISEPNYPVYYFDSKKDSLIIIYKKPLMGINYQTTEKYNEFILDKSVRVTDNILNDCYKIIFNKNKRILILYPDGVNCVRFFK